jgi:hypothetical protein
MNIYVGVHLKLTHSHTHTHRPTHTHTRTHSRTHARTHTHAHGLKTNATTQDNTANNTLGSNSTHTVRAQKSHTHAHTHTHSLSLTHSRTHAYIRRTHLPLSSKFFPQLTLSSWQGRWCSNLIPSWLMITSVRCVRALLVGCLVGFMWCCSHVLCCLCCACWVLLLLYAAEGLSLVVWVGPVGVFWSCSVFTRFWEWCVFDLLCRNIHFHLFPFVPSLVCVEDERGRASLGLVEVVPIRVLTKSGLCWFRSFQLSTTTTTV